VENCRERGGQDPALSEARLRASSRAAGNQARQALGGILAAASAGSGSDWRSAVSCSAGSVAASCLGAAGQLLTGARLRASSRAAGNQARQALGESLAAAGAAWTLILTARARRLELPAK
jgi:hypothetical protein